MALYKYLEPHFYCLYFFSIYWHIFDFFQKNKKNVCLWAMFMSYNSLYSFGISVMLLWNIWWLHFWHYLEGIWNFTIKSIPAVCTGDLFGLLYLFVKKESFGFRAQRILYLALYGCLKPNVPNRISGGYLYCLSIPALFYRFFIFVNESIGMYLPLLVFFEDV